MKTLAAFALSLTSLLAACGAARTVAATQPTPAAFDPTGSDPAAIEMVDASITALGGATKWQAVKELSFEIKYQLDGNVKAWYRHSWDRWNGRHRFESANQTPNPQDLTWDVVRYDLFDNDSRPYATDGKKRERMAEEARKAADIAKLRLATDAYFLSMIYKLRDPGVHLQNSGEVKDLKGACLPSCMSIKVSFEPEVGKDVWYVDINTETKIPEVVEKEVSGGRIGYRVSDWVDAGGLKWPGKLQNMGLEGELIVYSAVGVADPDDEKYMRMVK